MNVQPVVPQWAKNALNQVFEVERKNKKRGDPDGIQRNIDKLKMAFEEYGLIYEDPTGQLFSETRTDLDATIAGTETENLVVVDVIKPIIRVVIATEPARLTKVIQTGIVTVESRKER